MEGLSSPFLHVQCLKWPLVINLMGSGILHQFGPAERLHKANFSQSILWGNPTFSPIWLMWRHRHSRYLATYKQLLFWQYIGHHIRAILVGMDLLKLHQLRTHNISNSMIPHINVLASRVETWNLGKMDSVLALTKLIVLLLLHAHLLQKVLYICITLPCNH
jgi:hypothetical protein